VSDDSVTIRILGPGEESVLASVAPDVFDHAVRPEWARTFLADPRHHIVVAIAGGHVVGMATGLDYLHPDKDRQFFVNEVGVAAAHHRRGIGRALVERLLEHARTLGCVEAWVATEVDNAPALALYRATGGREDEAHAVVFTYDLRERR